MNTDGAATFLLISELEFLGIYTIVTIISVVVGVLLVVVSAINLRLLRRLHRDTFADQKILASRATLLDLTRSWNAAEMVAARVYGANTIKSYAGSPQSLHGQLTKRGELASWVHISTVAQFFYRLARLVIASEVDVALAKTEFAPAVAWWSDHIVAHYEGMGDERQLVEAMKSLKVIMSG